MGNKQNKTPRPKQSPTVTFPNPPLESNSVEANLPVTSPTKLPHRVISLTTLFRDITQYYSLERQEIGHGQYGIVRVGINQKTGEKVAVKSIIKEKVNNLDSLRSEIDILEKLNHQNIVRFKNVFEDNRYLHIVTELCDGGELFERILQKKKYTELEAAAVIRDILSAVLYCHQHHIVHRDLKPENLLYLTKEDSSPIKIIDFGLSKIYSIHFLDVTPDYQREDETLKTRVGTPFYIAPEVMDKQYGKECDMWSIGVILYILLCGYPPFYGSNDVDILRKVRKGIYSLSGKDWDNVSSDAKDIIQKLLVLDPKMRLTAEQALKHPWLHNSNTSVLNLVESLQKFSSHNKLKRAALRVIANTLTSTQITDLQRAFEEVDVERTGTVTVDQLREVMESRDLHETLSEVHNSLLNVPIARDTLIDYIELIAATLKRATYMDHERMMAAFQYFDQDGNGIISPEDMRSVMGRDTNLEEYFVGVKSPEKIDFQDFCAMMAAPTPSQRPPEGFLGF